jgi:cytochrome b pre-mRNA-processing protein 3
MSLFGNLFRRSSVATAAENLYKEAVQQARQPGFYAELGVADSVDGRFDLIAVHVFLLLHRLGQEGADGKALAQALFDLMFSDMDFNLREMGVSDLSVGKKVKTMAKAFYGRIAAYEAGLADEKVLGEALIRNLYRGAAVEATQVGLMAGYVRRMADHLAGQSLVDLKEGRVSFGSLQ